MEHSKGFLEIVKDAKSRVRETTPEEVRRRQETGDRFHLIDVREDNEWERGRALGALHMGKGVIERDIERAIPDRNEEIVLEEVTQTSEGSAGGGLTKVNLLAGAGNALFGDQSIEGH